MEVAARIKIIQESCKMLLQGAWGRNAPKNRSPDELPKAARRGKCFIS